jgi:hypothetical protein
MLFDENRDFGMLSPKALGGSPVTIHLVVKDADAVAQRAVEAGATLKMPVQDMFCATVTGWWRIRSVGGDATARADVGGGVGGGDWRGAPAIRPDGPVIFAVLPSLDLVVQLPIKRHNCNAILSMRERSRSDVRQLGGYRDRYATQRYGPAHDLP